MTGRWGWEGPPPEAYGRVTNPERFRPLHAAGRSLLATLEDQFVVARSSISASPEHPDATAVKLTPVDPAAAPLTMSFTAFPGLKIRIGTTVSMALPTCGCDACDEDVEECLQHLTPWITALTTGSITERLSRRGPRSWWHEVSTGSQGSTSGTLVEGQHSKQLRKALPTGEQHWTPWPARPLDSGRHL